MQVVARILAGIVWAINNPQKGVVEPEDLDHDFVLSIANPYLGKVAGYYTSWTPLQARKPLFSDQLDYAEPWQFINLRVS